MSWSVSALGKVAAVKKDLTEQFTRATASTANFPEEQAVVTNMHLTIDGQLDFLIANNPKAVVKVVAGGSASKAPADGSWPTSMQSNLLFEMVHGFVE